MQVTPTPTESVGFETPLDLCSPVAQTRRLELFLFGFMIIDSSNKFMLAFAMQVVIISYSGFARFDILLHYLLSFWLCVLVNGPGASTTRKCVTRVESHPLQFSYHQYMHI